MPDAPVPEETLAQVRELFGRLGTVVDVPEPLMRIAGATGGVGPAYWALLVEAQVDAAVRRGMPPALASTLVTETMAGSAAPWLNLFRRLPLRVGPLDLTPIVAIIALQILGGIVVSVIDPA